MMVLFARAARCARGFSSFEPKEDPDSEVVELMVYAGETFARGLGRDLFTRARARERGKGDEICRGAEQEVSR